MTVFLSSLQDSISIIFGRPHWRGSTGISKHDPCMRICIQINWKPTSAPAAGPVRAPCSPGARCSAQPAWRPCPPGCSPWSCPEAGSCGTPSGWRRAAAQSPSSPRPALSSSLLRTPSSGREGGRTGAMWEYVQQPTKPVNLRGRGNPRFILQGRSKKLKGSDVISLRSVSNSRKNTHKHHLCVPRPKHNKPSLGIPPLPATEARGCI